MDYLLKYGSFCLVKKIITIRKPETWLMGMWFYKVCMLMTQVEECPPQIHMKS